MVLVFKLHQTCFLFILCSPPYRTVSNGVVTISDATPQHHQSSSSSWQLTPPTTPTVTPPPNVTPDAEVAALAAVTTTPQVLLSCPEQAHNKTGKKSLKRIACEHCQKASGLNRTFDGKRSYVKHLQAAHADLGLHFCPFCMEKTFQHFISLRRQVLYLKYLAPIIYMALTIILINLTNDNHASQVF